MPTGRPDQKIPIQNIPLRTALGRRLREQYRKPILLDIDYAALEVWVLANLMDLTRSPETTRSKADPEEPSDP